MQIGIVGLPGSGKSTVFHALTGARAAGDGYARREQPSVAVVRVPDERLDRLVPMFKPKKTVYATVEFADIGGLQGAAADGTRQGFSSTLLASARQVDALAVVLGAYGEDAHPGSDLEEIELELNFADLSVIEKRLERLAADIKKSPAASRAGFEAEHELLTRLKVGLEQGTPIRALGVSAEEAKLLRGYGFLTEKPSFAIVNVAEDHAGATETQLELGQPGVTISGTIESEITELDPEDARAFLADLGIAEPGINRVIQVAYTTSNLISFLTVGPDEVRAWPIRNGSTALEAAGAIHTDIARGLIRAEVVSYDDLIACGGLVEARKAGVLRLESKSYIVKDGDICNFLSNV